VRLRWYWLFPPSLAFDGVSGYALAHRLTPLDFLVQMLVVTAAAVALTLRRDRRARAH
jgi:hypothetical protein